MKECNAELKSSFAPISNKEIEILILGTLPGAMSLECGEYYANPRNQFWKIISCITNASKIPDNYKDKVKLLKVNKIGIWDVIYQAERNGSLDENILNEIPNDLNKFISKCKNLKVVGFNGQKAHKLFRKHKFIRLKNINYIVLPSTSPANARKTFNEKCEEWQKIL